MSRQTAFAGAHRQQATSVPIGGWAKFRQASKAVQKSDLGFVALSAAPALHLILSDSAAAVSIAAAVLDRVEPSALALASIARVGEGEMPRAHVEREEDMRKSGKRKAEGENLKL